MKSIQTLFVYEKIRGGFFVAFFKQFPLQGKKGKDFKLFCQAGEIFKKKQHLTKEGIDQLRKIREFMNERRPMFG